MPKAGPITVRYADGRTETKTQGEFDRRKFSYARYRLSSHWRKLRLDVLERDGYRCCSCRAKAADKLLEVHHRTYERLGNERLDDLVTLCQRCHATEHQWRRRLGA